MRIILLISSPISLNIRWELGKTVCLIAIYLNQQGLNRAPGLHIAILCTIPKKFGKDAPMKTLAHAAYLQRVNLSANGFWKMPRIGYTWGNYNAETQKPMYYYFTQGVAVSEIELDVLTGSHTVLRTDIKMDIGRSINPAIDYGQIEGAFVQGLGLFTMEESLWMQDGRLATTGPGTYKIPGFSDIPQEFNVSFLQGVEWGHLRSIQSSKGVGEPPLFLGATACSRSEWRS